MNKYIIPICDIDGGSVYIMTIIAKSTSACQEKIMEELIDIYNIDDNISDYRDFIELIDEKYNILVGDIRDIEEL